MFRILVSNHTADVEADGDRRGRLFSTASPGVTLAGAFVVLSFCLVFMWPWWNRYLGLTNEGWFQLFGLQILQGLVPYRDFYLHVPPGQALTMAVLISVFGNRIVVGEMFGLIAAADHFLGSICVAGSHLSRILVGCRRHYRRGYLSRSFSRVAGWCAPGVHLVSSFGVSSGHLCP